MTKEQRTNLLNLYKDAHNQLITALKVFPVDMWNFKPSPKEWSIHEIIIHIADSELNSVSRCRKIIAENGGAIVAYNQDIWASSMNYHAQNTQDAIDLFRLLRKTTYDLLMLMPENIWENYAIHNEDGRFTLEHWLEIYANHIPGHINQMRRVYDSWLKRNK